MEHAKDDLGGEKTVGDEPEKYRRDDRGERTDLVCGGDSSLVIDATVQIDTDGDKPRSPDEKLEKHHH